MQENLENPVAEDVDHAGRPVVELTGEAEREGLEKARGGEREARPVGELRAFPRLDDVFDSLPNVPVNFTEDAFEAFHYSEILGSIRSALRDAEGRIATARDIMAVDLGMLDPMNGMASEGQAAVDSLQAAADVMDTASAVLDRWPNTFSGSRVVCLSEELWQALRAACPARNSCIRAQSVLAAAVKALASRPDRDTLILVEEHGPELGARLAAIERQPTAGAPAPDVASPSDRAAELLDDEGRELLAGLRSGRGWLAGRDAFSVEVMLPTVRNGNIDGEDGEGIFTRTVVGPRGLIERAILAVDDLCRQIERAGGDGEAVAE